MSAVYLEVMGNVGQRLTVNLERATRGVTVNLERATRGVTVNLERATRGVTTTCAI